MTPEQITEQRTIALALANETRVALADFKASIGRLDRDAGMLAVADLLDDPDRLAGVEGRIRVYQVLAAVRKLGSRRAEQLMVGAGILNGSRRLVDLSDRQRSVLGWLLIERAGAAR